jgi:4-amino-4-deoxy-L-arabinose transferase-like glycosyltransferase
MKRENLILILIILIAVLFRFWQLGKVPVAPDWDEASLGYNAYSVLKTGRDEYGTFIPAVLRSFDDYKPPLYMYLTIPSVAIFGLNIWAVRLPSALMGTLGVVGTYFLVNELIKLIDPKVRKKFIYLPLISTFLLAISPWHVHFSRIAFEANSGVFLNIWFLVFFFWGLKKFEFLNLSAVCAALALYAYHSERVFIPLFLIFLFFSYRKQLFETYKIKLYIPFVIGLFIIIPLIITFIDPSSWTRLKGTSALSDQTRILERSTKKIIDDQKNGNIIGQIFDNRRIVYIQKIAEGYLSHFSLRWLFITGDNDRHHAPDMGLIYIIELPFLLLGMYSVAKNGGQVSKLLLFWLVISPIAASPTSETPHAIRTLVVNPCLSIITSFGIVRLVELLKKYKSIIRTGIMILFVVLYLFNIFYYLHMYYMHLNHDYSYNWQYGYKQAVEVAQNEYDKVDKIIVSTSLEQPYIFFLFYLKYPPAKYLAQGGTKSGGFAEFRNKFDKYIFRKIDLSREVFDGKTLFIGPPKEMSSNYFETIYYLDGSPAINIGK